MATTLPILVAMHGGCIPDLNDQCRTQVSVEIRTNCRHKQTQRQRIVEGLIAELNSTKFARLVLSIACVNHKLSLLN